MRVLIAISLLLALCCKSYAVDCAMALEQAKGHPKISKAAGIKKAMSFGISRAEAEEYAKCFPSDRKHKRKSR